MILSLRYPIPTHETWEITDSTKLTEYMTCPRSYFYKYVLGWDSEEPNIHLVFGSAWHLAMEHLLLNGYGAQAILEAYNLLEEYYRQYFPPSMDEVHAPKIPGNAFNALLGYVEHWKDDRHETLYTEISGTVGMGTSRVFNTPRQLHFRQDSILRTEVGIKSREHKTGSTLSRVWRDQWLLSVQTGVYNHVLHCFFGDTEEPIAGVEINGTIFNKTKTQYERVPVYRSPDNMQNWFWNVNHHMDNLERDFVNLSQCSDNHDVMMAFPMNTTACTKFYGCPYHDFCAAWGNPIQHAMEVPVGLMVNFWDPTAEPSKVVAEF